MFRTPRTTFKLFRKCNSFCPLFFSLYFLSSSQVSESADVSGAEEDGNCADCKLAPPYGEFVHCANCERAPPYGKTVHCMKCDQRKRRQAVPDNKAPAVLYLPLGKIKVKKKPLEKRICKCCPCSIVTFVQTN